MGIDNYLVFLGASVIYALTPGVDFLLVLNRALFFGKNAGLLTTLGNCGGLLVHTILAALGISALVSQSETAFAVIQYGGACYLVIFGVLCLIKSRATAQAAAAGQTVHSARFYFVSGFTTNLFNPKIVLFFLAFFPQFVSRGAMGSPWPYAALGVSYIIITLVCLGLLSFFASAFATRVLHSPRFTVLMHRVTGVLFIGMGVSVALMKH